MSEEVKIKDGKVSISDREKYRALALDSGNTLSVPDVLVKAFKDAGLAYKWVSKAKIAKAGGHHPSGWMIYELNSAQKAALPKLYLGNIVSNYLERGDLILAVKPLELQEKARKDLQFRTKNQLESLENEVDAVGKPILRTES